MKQFVLKNAEGKFLDTEHHSALRHGRWRERPRLYKTLRGMRQALGGMTTPAFVKVIGERPQDTVRRDMSHAEREVELAKRRDYWAAVKAIPIAQYFELLAEDNIIVHEVEIDV